MIYGEMCLNIYKIPMYGEIQPDDQTHLELAQQPGATLERIVNVVFTQCKPQGGSVDRDDWKSEFWFQSVSQSYHRQIGATLHDCLATFDRSQVLSKHLFTPFLGYVSDVSGRTTFEACDAQHFATDLFEEFDDVFVTNVGVWCEDADFLGFEFLERESAGLSASGDVEASAALQLGFELLVTFPASEECFERHSHHNVLRFGGHQSIYGDEDLATELSEELEHVFISGQFGRVDQDA